MARKFLYIIAIIIVLVLGVLFALRIWSQELTEITFVPTAKFEPQPPLAVSSYDDPAMWISRPGIGAPGIGVPGIGLSGMEEGDPALTLPEGFTPEEQAFGAAVFFIHPTSYFEKARWNAPLDHEKSRELAETFVRGMASPFNRAASIWAPRYRQATIGSFLTEAPETREALDLAYGDVLQAFDYFLASTPMDIPIVLAGHSQGAFHLKRLLLERVAGTPLAQRIAAAYVVGWPVSLEHDLPVMGLTQCTAPDQTGCVMSWLSYAEPADTAMTLKAYGRFPGLDGVPQENRPFLCSNPLTGQQGTEHAPASANLGTLVPSKDRKSASLAKAMVPARCGDDGFLYIGAPPKLGHYVLPGNNYHVYDIPLFWANLREDVARRVAAWQP